MRILIAIVFAFFALSVVPANAEVPKRSAPVLTGDPIYDLKKATKSDDASKTDDDSSCDFNLFAALTARNVISSIRKCIKSDISDKASEFVPQVEGALESAKAAKDQPGVQCLEPALAIVKAAIIVPPTEAKAATDSSPAVAATPGNSPGPILIFQKFREFALAGGPAACKTWVNSTIAMANPLTN